MFLPGKSVPVCLGAAARDTAAAFAPLPSWDGGGAGNSVLVHEVDELLFGMDAQLAVDGLRVPLHGAERQVEHL